MKNFRKYKKDGVCSSTGVEHLPSKYKVLRTTKRKWVVRVCLCPSVPSSRLLLHTDLWKHPAAMSADQRLLLLGILRWGMGCHLTASLCEDSDVHWHSGAGFVLFWICESMLGWSAYQKIKTHLELDGYKEGLFTQVGSGDPQSTSNHRTEVRENQGAAAGRRDPVVFSW